MTSEESQIGNMASVKATFVPDLDTASPTLEKTGVLRGVGYVLACRRFLPWFDNWRRGLREPVLGLPLIDQRPSRRLAIHPVFHRRFPQFEKGNRHWARPGETSVEVGSALRPSDQA